jgi:hypothetical protein
LEDVWCNNETKTNIICNVNTMPSPPQRGELDFSRELEKEKELYTNNETIDAGSTMDVCMFIPLF